MKLQKLEETIETRLESVRKLLESAREDIDIRQYQGDIRSLRWVLTKMKDDSHGI